jgi:hypothetical protein
MPEVLQNPTISIGFTPLKSFGITLAHKRRMTMGTNKQRVITFIHQNGDKRSGIERRRFTYHAHIPERRSGQDRRTEGARRELAAESYNGIALG